MRAPPVAGLFGALLPEVLAVGWLSMADTVVPKGKARLRAPLSALTLEKIPVSGSFESARSREMAVAWLELLTVIVVVMSTEPATTSIVTAERTTPAAVATTSRMSVCTLVSKALSRPSTRKVERTTWRLEELSLPVSLLPASLLPVLLLPVLLLPVLLLLVSLLPVLLLPVSLLPVLLLPVLSDCPVGVPHTSQPVRTSESSLRQRN